MEIIELPGYTFDDKVHIATNHLLKKQIKEHGLSETNIEISQAALAKLIGSYTREAGVRTWSAASPTSAARSRSTWPRARRRAG